MPIKKKYGEALYQEYDGLVNLTLANLYSLSKNIKTIRLLGLDPKNKEHLFILRIAIIARDLFHFPIEVELSWWKYFLLNWKMRKTFEKVGRVITKGHYDIQIDELLNFMRLDGKERIGEGFSFADIYEAYYEGSLN